MPTIIKKFANSRKFWAFVIGLVTLTGGAFEDGAISAQEAQAISGLVIGYIVSVAYEDSQQAQAQAVVDAAATNANATIQAATVGVPPSPPIITPGAEIISSGDHTFTDRRTGEPL